MKHTFPGYLYAMSLRPGEPPGKGYREWFSHPDLFQRRKLVESLRDSFHWQTDSARKHPPVVVLEPLTGGKSVLVVRFLDAGKDSYGRPQTLRMEALLVPAKLAAPFWDGSFSAEPDEERAEFRVNAADAPSGFPGLDGKRLVHGDPETFFLDGTSSPRRNAPVPCPARLESAPPDSPSTPPPSDRDPMKIPFFAALLALLVSLAANVWILRTSADERETLQSRLSQTERQLEDLRVQMDGLESERAALVSFRGQSESFADAIDELRRITARLDGIRTAVETTAASNDGPEE